MDRVTAPPLAGGWYERPPAGRLYHSRFNPAWLDELGIASSVIIDAGAFDGGDAIRFKDRWPAAKVVAIEADPTVYLALAVSVGAAGNGVQIIHCAVAERDDGRDWFQARLDGKIDSQGSLYRQTDAMNRRFPRVRQSPVSIFTLGRRLDSICRTIEAERIDLLHMDVQGAEHAALVGLGALRPELIWLETTDDGWVGVPGKAAIGALLAGMGYARIGDFGNDELHRFRGHA